MACDRRVEADQADSGAPLTALCPVPMPPFLIYSRDLGEERGWVMSFQRVVDLLGEPKTA